MKLSLRFDLRLAPFSPLTREQLYKACLDQCAFIEEAGFDEVSLPEHHSAEDGYCPSNIVLGAAIAARTRRITIALKAILLPLHNPIRLAEDLAVLDLISNGRLRVLFGGGYRPVEYRLFGVDIRDRARLMADKVAVLRKAWSGETFDVDGSKIRVTPAPSQPGGPKIIFGGSTEWSARRAAEMADGYDPTPQAIDTFEVYRRECARLGKTPGEPRPRHLSCVFLMVAKDPESVWRAVAPYALHESNSYGEWSAEAGLITGYTRASDAEDLRRSGRYRVMTPEDCVKAAQDLGRNGHLILHPLISGLPVELSWQSLHLFKDEVMPALKEAGLWKPPISQGVP